MQSPTTTMIRRAALGLVTIGAAVALGGCGLIPRPAPPAPPDTDTTPETTDETQETTSSDLRSGPIPSENPRFDESDLPPEPGDSAPPSEQIEWELLKYTNNFGVEYDPSSSASCDETDGTIDETITCTVTYGGKDAIFTVDITGGSSTFTYEYTADELPISRQAAEDAYRWYTDSEMVACDMQEYEMVTVGDTGVTCEADSPTGPRSATIETTKTGGSFLFNEL